MVLEVSLQWQSPDPEEGLYEVSTVDPLKAYCHTVAQETKSTLFHWQAKMLPKKKTGSRELERPSQDRKQDGGGQTAQEESSGETVEGTLKSTDFSMR